MAVFATSVLSGRGEVIMSVEFEKAVQDPASVFDKPEDVLRDVSLTREQKIEILSRCEYNASQEAVPLEEGMPGDETGILKRILIALGEVAGPSIST